MYWRSAVLAASRCVLLVRFVLVVRMRRAVLPQRVARRAHEDDGPVLVPAQLGHVFGDVDRDAFGVQPACAALLRDVVGLQAVAADDGRSGLLRRAVNCEGAFVLRVLTGAERGAEVGMARAGGTGKDQDPDLAVVRPSCDSTWGRCRGTRCRSDPSSTAKRLRQVAVDRGLVGVRAMRVLRGGAGTEECQHCRCDHRAPRTRRGFNLVIHG